MFQSKYLILLIVTALIFEKNQLISAKVCKCNLFCDDDKVIDLKMCTCTAKLLDESERRIRSLDRIASVSELIRGDEFTSQSSNHRCSNDELWNGSACISSISVCPGGYHWNGHACIIQSSIQTAALVPSDPGKKCKYTQQYAQHREEELSYNNGLAATVAPTISTSPMCPFSFIWSENGCVQSSPTCPTGYSYYRNVCHLNASQSTERIAEITTETVKNQAMPMIDEIQSQYSIKSNKWQQSQSISESENDTNFNSNNKLTIEQSIAETNDDKNISYDQNHQCCSIMSPRICQRISNNPNEQWRCYHHKHRLCDDVCTKPNIFMRPKQFSFIKTTLIMPPPPPRLMKLIQKHAHREINIGKNCK